MPEPGEILIRNGRHYIYLRCYPRPGSGGRSSFDWIDVGQFGLPELEAELRQLPQGAIVDMHSLAYHAVVVVYRPPAPHVIDDDTMKWIEVFAESTGIRLEEE